MLSASGGAGVIRCLGSPEHSSRILRTEMTGELQPIKIWVITSPACNTVTLWCQPHLLGHGDSLWVGGGRGL